MPFNIYMGFLDPSPPLPSPVISAPTAQAAFRTHPDRVHSEAEKGAAAERFRRVATAYSVLRASHRR